MFISILLPMAIGFTVFLAGMKIMELALHRWAGPYLTSILHRSTATPIHGLAVGTLTTAFLQSSTAVTVITIGLVNSGILTFQRTLGIVLGTNIGTCITTELIGLNLNKLSLPLLELSIAVWLFTVLLDEYGLWKNAGRSVWLQSLRFIAVACGGFAMLLAGMGMMQSVAPHVQSSGLFSWFLEQSGSTVPLGMAAGMVLTAAIHSSAAVIGIVMGFVTLGAMPVELGIAVVLGANIGTCATPLLASIGGSVPGQFVAWAHMSLNLGGALLFAPLVHELQAVSAWFTSDPAGQIAHAQTLFNIASSLLALPLCYLPMLRRHSPSHSL
ncbi:Na/Pi cotransporter family protein [Paenibacillus abyssi]|uniref:Na/Pi-cotransporter n=1 Tax=Paenibacillus abyssi TaxID=1340531 RepID=A0A917D4T2_9BACL|nr:Na/Pi symporter [Paenibacillus abyssi]GGG10788.1 Na/Pi-cotransporter [Paenibacillus abyssi]